MTLSIAKRLWLKEEIQESYIDGKKVTRTIEELGEKFVPVPVYLL